MSRMVITLDPIASIRDELRRSIHGDAWHGPSLLESLRDVTALESATRSIPGAHTIAEIVPHCAGWMREVVRRLSGLPPGEPPGGDWPTPPPAHETAWAAALADLEAAAEELDQALSRLGPEDLLNTVSNGERDAALGTGLSFALTLHGVAQHNAYHAGQVVLLKRAARSAAQLADAIPSLPT